jgi:hypothetical protein
MDKPDDIGGRSGIFPRIDLHAPEPPLAEPPAPRRRPLPAESDPNLDAQTAAEGDDPARDGVEADPDAGAL